MKAPRDSMGRTGGEKEEERGEASGESVEAESEEKSCPPTSLRASTASPTVTVSATPQPHSTANDSTPASCSRDSETSLCCPFDDRGQWTSSSASNSSAVRDGAREGAWTGVWPNKEEEADMERR